MNQDSRLLLTRFINDYARKSTGELKESGPNSV